MARMNTNGTAAPIVPAMILTLKKRLIAGAMLDKPVTVASVRLSAPAFSCGCAAFLTAPAVPATPTRTTLLIIAPPATLS